VSYKTSLICQNWPTERCRLLSWDVHIGFISTIVLRRLFDTFNLLLLIDAIQRIVTT